MGVHPGLGPAFVDVQPSPTAKGNPKQTRANSDDQDKLAIMLFPTLAQSTPADSPIVRCCLQR
jgi:hypothetical protein